MSRLFDFTLKPTEAIQPWGQEPNLKLTWYALTDGFFHMNVGKSKLFQYNSVILKHWELPVEAIYPDYMVAAFVRDILDCMGAALSPLPEFLQAHAWDWEHLRVLQTQSREHDESYEAFRWLGQRSPWTSYLTACPAISFIRKNDTVIIAWDNRDCVVDGIAVWEAQLGTFEISVDDFSKECRLLADELLDQMAIRIKRLETGEFKSQVEVNISSLTEQQDNWRDEFNRYFSTSPSEPDISWEECHAAWTNIGLIP